MHIQQYFRLGELTASYLDTQFTSLTDEVRAWLVSQLNITPLVCHEEDCDLFWDPHEISLHEGTLVRFRITHINSHPLLTEHSLSVAISRGDVTLEHQMTSEPPVDWKTYYHERPLPYEGVVGRLGCPKRVHFRTYAKSPASAWQKVTSDLMNAGHEANDLALYDIGLGAMSFSMFKNRNNRPSDEQGTSARDACEIKPNQKVAREVERILASSEMSGKKGFERPFLLGKIMADYGLVAPSADGEYTYHGLALQAATGEAYPVSHLKDDVLYMSEENHLCVSHPDMFSFTADEKKALTVEPSIRFLVMNNIPVDAALTLRQQQAWCQHHLHECA